MSIRTVKSEIHNVLSTLRLTDRSISSRFQNEVLLRDESAVVRRLKSLHGYLLEFDHLEHVDAITFLDPFLEVIRTPNSNGVVTGVVLSALNKLLLYGCITGESPRGPEAVNDAVQAICNCRFEASHHYADEIVLLQLLELLVSLLRCPVGDRITEDNAWALVQVCFRMAVDPALSELLRAAAANSLSHVVLTVFGRAAELMVAVVESNNTPITSPAGDAPFGANFLAKMLAFLAKLTDPTSSNAELLGVLAATSTSNTAFGGSSLSSNESIRAMGLQLTNIALETAGEALGSHEGCVRVVQNDLSKHLLLNSQTDDLPVLALTLRVVYNLFFAMKGHLKVQLEVFMTSVHFRIVDSTSASNEKKELALESLLDFCHDPSIVLDLHANYDCDVNCSNLFEGLCRLLGKRAAPEPGTALTALHVLALEGTYSIVSHIASRCVPASPGDDEYQSEENVNKSTSDGTFDTRRGSSRTKTNTKDEELILRKTHKRRLLLVGAQFNKAPNKSYWREYGCELGIFTAPLVVVANNTSLPPPPTTEDAEFAVAVTSTTDAASSTTEMEPPASNTATLSNTPSVDEIATFLLTAPGLNKSAIGDFLSDNDVLGRDTLKMYVSKFEMRDIRVDAALRNVLECFRIPGEAQKIERVMESFSAEYYKQNPNAIFLSSDAVFIFSFSIVMLHTDAHSRSIPQDKRMTLEQFIKNVRGVNDGKDFDDLFLREVYNSVREKEFIISFDTTGGSGGAADGSTAAVRSWEWDGVLRHSSKVEFARFSKTGHFKRAGLHERDMFEILFEPTLHTLDAALESTLDGRVLIRSLRCAGDLARIASFFSCDELLNQIVILLCKHYFKLLREKPLSDSFRSIHAVDDVVTLALAERAEADSPLDSFESPIKDRERRKLAQLNSTVEFNAGNPYSPARALLIARTIMFLCQSFSGSVREGWTNAVRVFANLMTDGLLPTLGLEDVALSSEDQKLLSDERTLFEERKSRLFRFTSSTSSSAGVGTSASPARQASRLAFSSPSSVVSEGFDSSADFRVPNGEQHDGTHESEDSDGGGDGGDDDDETASSGGESNSPEKKSSSVWNTVTSFFFGGSHDGRFANKTDAHDELKWKSLKSYTRAVRACRAFFKSSRVFDGTIRATASSSEDSLSHLLGALSNPFSSTPPVWCSTWEYTPATAASILDFVTLVASANRSKLDKIWPILDRVYAFALDSNDSFVGTRAADDFFEICYAMASPTSSFSLLKPFHYFSQTIDCLGRRVLVDRDVNFSACRGLTMMDFEVEDVESWKNWFQVLTKCTQSDPDRALDALERVLCKRTTRLAKMNNVLAVSDLLTDLLSNEDVSPDTRARAAAGFRMVSTDQTEADDAIWTMILATLKSFWNDPDPRIHNEITASLQAVLMEGATLEMNVKLESRVRRAYIALDRVLMPLIMESRGDRRNDAESLLARYFLVLAGSFDGDEIVDALLVAVVTALSSDFADSHAADDVREASTQRLMNVLNIVVVGTPFQDRRLSLVQAQLDVILPNWRVGAGM